MADDILDCGEGYEVHPTADKKGNRDGGWAVVYSPSGEVLAKYSDKLLAKLDAKDRAWHRAYPASEVT